MRTRSSLATAERVRGAVLAGAVGDAIGSQVEFATTDDIRERYGCGGLTGMADLVAPAGAIGDETQLTVFTLDALIRGYQQWEDEARCPRIDLALASYWRWLHTQGEVPMGIPLDAYFDGWLVHEPVLRVQRNPSFWCVTALASGARGAPDHPVNLSSRVGPLGRVGVLGLLLDDPLHVARDNAALTHGHPDTLWSAGALALIVRSVADGEQIADAVEETVATLSPAPEARTVRAALRDAVDLAGRGPATPERLAELGHGWDAPEALAYAVCCALAASDGVEALQSAVNHSGPSDTVASACGHIVGAGTGADWLPESWVAALDAGSLLHTVIDDAITRCVDGLPIDRKRYPAHRDIDVVKTTDPTL